MDLKLLNKITKQEILLEGITDNMVSNFFYNFKINLPKDAVDGEYEYTLIQDEKVIASGLAVIGNFVPEKKNYNNTTKTYKTYGE